MDFDSSRPESQVLRDYEEQDPWKRDFGDLLYEFAQLFGKFLDSYYRKYGHEHPLTAEQVKRALGE